MLHPSLERLYELTENFFRLHWNENEIGVLAPKWSEKYIFQGGNLPNYDKQGVYAFLKGDEVTYVGVAASKGNDNYRGQGLGKRFQSYSHVVNDIHTPKDPRLVDAGGIMTIGFEPEQAYLANALELYLIGRIDTQHNINRPGS